MGVDWFLASISEGDGNIPPEALATLARKAEGFLRAGGTLSWAEWVVLGPVAQVVWENAGNRLWIERAGLLGLAGLSRAGAIEVLSKVDSGKAKLVAALSDVMRGAVERLEATAT